MAKMEELVQLQHCSIMLTMNCTFLGGKKITPDHLL